jgi:hypothetical protein
LHGTPFVESGVLPFILTYRKYPTHNDPYHV